MGILKFRELQTAIEVLKLGFVQQLNVDKETMSVFLNLFENVLRRDLYFYVMNCELILSFIQDVTGFDNFNK